MTIIENAKEDVESESLNNIGSDVLSDEPVSVQEDKAEDKKVNSVKKTPYIVAISLLSTALVVMGTVFLLVMINRNSEIFELKANEAILNQTISEQSSIIAKNEYQSGFDKTRIKTLEDRVDHLQESYDDLKQEVILLRTNVVFTSDRTMTYHDLDCKQHNIFREEVHDESYAIAKGYKPCPACH